MPEKISRKSGGSRKIGRNIKKCARYRLENRREKNKKRKMEKRKRKYERNRKKREKMKK